ncbi:MAG: prolyl oligopeptidase family serine peptidase [Alphaproteobacteria bacterium]|nr:prolyl oligopeptidase family serine peptidase [Alphaproteobacteria bacterium]
MTLPQTAPYGTWRSPVTADLIAAGSVGLGQIALDGGDVYWSVLRPSEGGRTAIERCDASGAVADILPAEYSARTRVHEYGGGAFAVHAGTVWFCNDADQRIYRQDAGEAPVAVTPAGSRRFADLIVDAGRRRLIAVLEDHGAGGKEPANSLVAVAAGGTIETLAAGADFYAAPRLSPDGRQLAWLSWTHPNMPWDGCTLSVAPVADGGAVGKTETVAGGAAEALFQPEWSPGGELFFVSDRSGWWNLYRWADGVVRPVCPLPLELGLPQWLFNMRTYGFLSPARILAVGQVDGIAKLMTLDTAAGTAETMVAPFVEMHGLVAGPARAAFVGGGLRDTPVIAALDPSAGTVQTLRRSSGARIDPGHVSLPQAVSYESAGGRVAHAFYYAPQNSEFSPPGGELPPLIVKSHGGPTGQSGCGFSLKTQFWTSRGFAVLEVNYGGSTGYGRDYRRQLAGQWGVVDVEDCAAGARWLAAQGLADPKRLAITGGSAGGYTTLCALTFGDVFAAGASHYGIGDLEALVRDTHKFESRYMDSLVGPWPEARETYRARSPIHHADRLDCPVIFFQGTEDKVVPPNQAEDMVAALRGKGIPVACLLFEGEGHGFRRAENIKRALEAELGFYGRIFGFSPHGIAEIVKIDNLA